MRLPVFDNVHARILGYEPADSLVVASLQTLDSPPSGFTGHNVRAQAEVVFRLDGTFPGLSDEAVRDLATEALVRRLAAFLYGPVIDELLTLADELAAEGCLTPVMERRIHEMVMTMTGRR